ncbi:MAG: D-mannonate dehydratase [Hyphomicrobiales bacterium]|nr:MAG: D-mannonate dehydratase [Hyphomicrobiales bacterium]
MRVGLTLSGDRLSEDGAVFARQLGVSDVVIHLNTYGRGDGAAAFNDGSAVGPFNGDVIDEPLWDFEKMSAAVGMLKAHGLAVAALENFSPKFWYDILLDGPNKREQIENLKRLVRDAGKAGIPVIGYNFSLAGVWGWKRKPVARGGAWTVDFDMSAFDHAEPIPDGMIWNMRYRAALPGAAPVTVGHDELWQRLAWFLAELVPVAEEAGVRLAAHPDDPPAEFLRGTARLVNSHAKYDRLLDLVPSRSNALEFCIGSLAEMPEGDVYETTRHFARRDALAYVHFRNVRGKVPHYVETFVDEGDIDMAEIVRILRDENFQGVLVPDHVPDLIGPSPWHSGNAYTVGYMRALIQNAQDLGPSRTASAPRREER